MTNLKILPRDYQDQAVDECLSYFGEGISKVILYMPTGAGKTPTAAFIADHGVWFNNLRTLFLADINVIRHQTAQRFTQYGLEYQQLWGDTDKDNGCPVAISTPQTLLARTEAGTWDFSPHIIIVDEAHEVHDNIYSYARDIGAMIIAMSATPFTKNIIEKFRFNSKVISPVTTFDLWDRGLLDRPKVHILPDCHSNYPVKNKDDALRIWSLFEQSLENPSTLMFVNTIYEGTELSLKLFDVGFNFPITTYKDSVDHSIELVRQMNNREVDGLISVRKLAKGLDSDVVNCILNFRNLSVSLSSYVQALGRLMRYSNSKSYMVDATGNTEKFGLRAYSLFRRGISHVTDFSESDRNLGSFTMTCPRCSFVVPNWSECINCDPMNSLNSRQ